MQHCNQWCNQWWSNYIAIGDAILQSVIQSMINWWCSYIAIGDAINDDATILQSVTQYCNRWCNYIAIRNALNDDATFQQCNNETTVTAQECNRRCNDDATDEATKMHRTIEMSANWNDSILFTKQRENLQLPLKIGHIRYMQGIYTNLQEDRAILMQENTFSKLIWKKMKKKTNPENRLGNHLSDLQFILSDGAIMQRN